MTAPQPSACERRQRTVIAMTSPTAHLDLTAPAILTLCLEHATAALATGGVVTWWAGRPANTELAPGTLPVPARVVPARSDGILMALAKNWALLATRDSRNTAPPAHGGGPAFADVATTLYLALTAQDTSELPEHDLDMLTWAKSAHVDAGELLDHLHTELRTDLLGVVVPADHPGAVHLEVTEPGSVVLDDQDDRGWTSTTTSVWVAPLTTEQRQALLPSVGQLNGVVTPATFEADPTGSAISPR